jgi:putative transposase
MIATKLNPYRGQPSGVKEFGDRWAVHYDPYDVTRVWVRNHHDGGWITAYWRQLHNSPQPFGDAAWQYARRVVAERGTETPNEETIKSAVDDLLDRAAPPAPAKPRKKTAKARRVAARTTATTTAATRPDVPSPHTAAPASYAQTEPEESVADVIPLPVFNPDKEAQSWW